MISDLSVAIPIAVACLVISAFCSGTETALFSIRRPDREKLTRNTGFADRWIVAMLGKPRRLISTVLVGKVAFNSLFAVLAMHVLSRWYPPWSAFWLAVAIALPLVVLFTELTAKTLAAKSPLLWARLCVLPLAIFAVIVTPARWVVQGLSTALLGPFGLATRARPARDLSEEEFRTLVDAGSAQGQVNASERRLIHRVFEFSDKNVGQVMTPRERIFSLSYELPAARLVKELAARGFSRVPIYQKSLDNVRGVLNAKDLVRTTAGQPLGRPLGELLHEPLFVPRTTPIKRLFLTFKQKKVHMAIVVSEYGKVLGLVTMDDLLAQIFGVLRDERAALQSSLPPGGGTAGRPAVRDRGDVRAEVASGDGASGDGASQSAMLDPPPLPAYETDEVTPPATDLADLDPGRGAVLGRAPSDETPPALDFDELPPRRMRTIPPESRRSRAVTPAADLDLDDPRDAARTRSDDS